MKNPDQLRKYGESLRARIAVALGLATIAWLSSFGEVQAQRPGDNLSRSRMEWMTEVGPGTHNISREDRGKRENRMALAGDYANLETNNIESGNRDPEDDGTEFVNNTLKIILKPILCIILLIGPPTLAYINAVRKARDLSQEDILFKSRSKARPTTRRTRLFNAEILERLSGKKRENKSNVSTEHSNIKEESSGADEVVAIMRNKCARRPLSGERIGDSHTQVVMKGNSMVGVFNDGEKITLNRRDYIIAASGEFGQVGDMVAIEYRPRKEGNVESIATAIGIYAGIFKGYPLLLSTHNTKGKERGGHGLITSVPVEPGDDIRTCVLWSISKSQTNAEELVKKMVGIIMERGDYYPNESR